MIVLVTDLVTDLVVTDSVTDSSLMNCEKRRGFSRQPCLTLILQSNNSEWLQYFVVDTIERFLEVYKTQYKWFVCNFKFFNKLLMLTKYRLYDVLACMKPNWFFDIYLHHNYKCLPIAVVKISLKRYTPVVIR